MKSGALPVVIGCVLVVGFVLRACRGYDRWQTLNPSPEQVERDKQKEEERFVKARLRRQEIQKIRDSLPPGLSQEEREKRVAETLENLGKELTQLRNQSMQQFLDSTSGGSPPDPAIKKRMAELEWLSSF